MGAVPGMRRAKRLSAAKEAELQRSITRMWNEGALPRIVYVPPGVLVQIRGRRPSKLKRSRASCSSDRLRRLTKGHAGPHVVLGRDITEGR